MNGKPVDLELNRFLHRPGDEPLTNAYGVLYEDPVRQELHHLADQVNRLATPRGGNALPINVGLRVASARLRRLSPNNSTSLFAIRTECCRRTMGAVDHVTAAGFDEARDAILLYARSQAKGRDQCCRKTHVPLLVALYWWAEDDDRAYLASLPKHGVAP